MPGPCALRRRFPKGDDRKFACRRLRAQQFAEGEAVDARHLEIECDEVATHAFQHTKCGGGFVCGHDTILRGLEDFAQAVACGSVVVNY